MLALNLLARLTKVRNSVILIVAIAFAGPSFCSAQDPCSGFQKVIDNLNTKLDKAEASLTDDICKGSARLECIKRIQSLHSQIQAEEKALRDCQKQKHTHFAPCGTFYFAADPGEASNFGPTRVPLMVLFKFDPADCKPPVSVAQCDKIVFIQIIRESDPNVAIPANVKSKYSIFPDTEYFTRQTDSGYSVDVSSGRKLGYYGLDDEGKPITPTIAVIGNNSPNWVIASIHDTPSFSSTIHGANLTGAPPHETLFEAIDVPVCTQGDSASNNKILGYLHWRIRADTTNKITDFGATFSDDDYGAVVQEAIAAWNNHLNDGSTRKTAFPDLKPL